jgi:hypothetical protein
VFPCTNSVSLRDLTGISVYMSTYIAFTIAGQESVTVPCVSREAANDLVMRLQPSVRAIFLAHARFGRNDQWRDVTEALRILMAGKTHVHRPVGSAIAWYVTDLCGGHDPAPGVPKLLIVDYVCQGKATSLVFQENQNIDL